MGQQSQPPRAGRPACVPSGSGGGGRCAPTTEERTELRSVGAPQSWWFRVCSVEDVEEQGNRPPNPPLDMDLGPISCSLLPPGRPALPCHPCHRPRPDEVPPLQFAGSDVAPPPYPALPPAQYQLCPTGLETIPRGCAVASSHIPSPVQSARLGASSLGLGRFRSHFMGLHPQARGGRAWAHGGRRIKQIPSEASALQLPSLGLPASAPGLRQSLRRVLAGLLSQAISILEL